MSESDHWFDWLIVWTVVVAVGCAMEFGESVIEWLEWRWHRKNKPFQENKGRWTIPLSILGILLVVGGIACEGYSEAKEATAETAVRNHDEAILGKAELDAADAQQKTATLESQTEGLKLAELKAQLELARLTGPMQEVPVINGVAEPSPLKGTKLRILLHRDTLIKFPTLPKGMALSWKLIIVEDEVGQHQFRTYPKQFMPGPSPGQAYQLYLAPGTSISMDLISDETGTMDQSFGGATIMNAPVDTAKPK